MADYSLFVKIFHCCTFTILLLTGCASLPPLPPAIQMPLTIPETVPKQTESVHIIGPEDTVNIIVYGHQDLSTQIVVSAEGVFTYPLLGEIRATGLTARQLESQLTMKLAEYVVNPQVSVTVTRFQSQQVYVIGEVKSPGPYELPHATTLIEILTRAGGLTPNAGWEVVVAQGAKGIDSEGTGRNPIAEDNIKIRVDLEQLLAGQVARPIVVQGGDIVYVPPAGYIYVSGEVQRPGRYRLERNTTVAKALIMAGGLTRFAAPKRLQVRRSVAGQPQDFYANVADLLQAEDVLIVPESIF
jgi:polysaccharide export outer membrane protein